VVSGIRATGKLHIGNYWGAMKNFIEFQDKYDCFYFIADWHALTTASERTEELNENTRAIVTSWLAAGLDPEKCVIFRQSDVKEHAELALLLGMVTPISWLLRNPTFKDQLQELYRARYKGQEDKIKKVEGVARQLAEAHGHSADELAIHSDMAVFGFLGYPVLMAADILLYDASYVPIGRDQLPHLELTRDIARRFNHVFKTDVFREPEPIFTKMPVVPGLDGRKMSKSYGNCVELDDCGAELEGKIKKMFTDPGKIKIDDKGNPDGCVVFALHRLYNPDCASRETECREGKIGCGQCKKHLFSLMNPVMTEFKARKESYAKDGTLVGKVLREGAERAGAAASAKMARVNKEVKIA